MVMNSILMQCFFLKPHKNIVVVPLHPLHIVLNRFYGLLNISC